MHDRSRSLIFIFFCALVVSTGLVFLMWPTAQSMVKIWHRSDTFTHGYLVFPASVVLIWLKRNQLVAYNTSPDWRFLPLLIIAGFFWLLAVISGIQVVEHTAFVSILIVSLFAILGRHLSSIIKFPLLFLIFMAPIGDELVPLLMELTADITVSAIRITGIPIYREGLFFSLPSGNWSVVEACSGIRYLIASLALGTLYAYLNYSSIWRRLLFIALAAVIPLIANSVRAFLIVMIGHLSNNKLATGVDHLVYGWLFFGIVMFALFSIGSLFHESNAVNPDSETTTKTKPDRENVNIYAFVAGCMLIFGLIAVWPVWASKIQNHSSAHLLTLNNANDILPNSTTLNATKLESTIDTWYPRMSGYQKGFQAIYTESDVMPIRALVFLYLDQTQDKEMINSSNTLISNKDNNWRKVSNGSINIELDNGSNNYQIETNTLRSASSTLQVWKWFRIGDSVTTSNVEAKLLELKDKLMLKASVSATYFLIADGNIEDTKHALNKNAVKLLNTNKITK